jgi:hypothetical protein
MSDAHARRWTSTYLFVMAVEILTLLGLWWLQRYFGA